MNKLPLILFWLLGIIWGSNFIYMKWAADFISPLQIVFLRVLFGFIPVFIYALYKCSFKTSHLKYIGHFFAMSLIATVIYYFGFVKGASLLPSGIAGALSASIPIFSLVLALLFLADEKATINRIVGVSIGFLGVILIARPFSADIASTNIEGVVYMVLGSLSVGASFVYAKKYVMPLKIPATALTTYQLGLGLVFLFAITDMQGISKVTTDLHVALGLILGLGILGKGVAYIIYYYIIEKLGAVAASSVTYIPPIVALAIGVFLVGEDIELIEYLAAALILGGVILLNTKSGVNKELS